MWAWRVVVGVFDALQCVAFMAALAGPLVGLWWCVHLLAAIETLTIAAVTLAYVKALVAMAAWMVASAVVLGAARTASRALTARAHDRRVTW